MRSSAVALGAVLLFAACGTAGRGELIVSAASSLTEVFEQLEAEFEATHPDVDVVLNFGGSSTLREQIIAGAPVDVFASASSSIMDEVAAAGLVEGDPVVFATNRLVIAIPSGNPGGVTGLADLADPDLLVGLCAATVPCGALAVDVLAAAGIEVAPDTHEPDVRALRTKIMLGELDAGLIYASDVTDEPTLEMIEIGIDGFITRYSIAVMSTSDDLEQARRFVEGMTSPGAEALLDAAGFGTP